MNQTVSSVILSVAKRHGVKYVFGLPAAQIGQVMDGAAKDPHFSYVTTRHEEAAGHMAHAVGKLTNTAAICFGTVGPGATNMVPGVACAWACNVPVFALTPNNQSFLVDPGQDLLQHVDQIGLYKPITKWNAGLRYPRRAGELAERALHLAHAGRPGPVHLDIPVDIGYAPCEYDLDSRPVMGRPRPAANAADLQAAVDLLTRAKRPLLVAGGGVARADGVAAFRDLLAVSQLPAVTSCNGKGTVPLEYPMHLGSGGVLGGQAVVDAAQQADVILAVGCKFSSMMPINKPPAHPVPPGQTIIQVDIEAETLGRNAPTGLGIVADARVFLEQLTAALDGASFAVDREWVGQMVAGYRAYRQQVDAVADAVTSEGTNLLNEAAIAREAARHLPDDAILAIDGGQIMEWGVTYWHPRDPQSFLFGPGMGHLGMGLPFANAAKLVHPDRPVFLITGDGAMGMTGQELETAVRYGLNIIVLVANDSFWGMYRPLGEAIMQNPDFGTKLTNVDFAKVAEGYGCHAEQVTTLDQIGPAIARAREAGRPAVIDILCDFTQHPMDGFWPNVIMESVAVAPCPAT